MKRALWTSIALVAWWGCGLATAQAREPHLIPVDPELAVFEHFRPYKLAVRERLLGHEATTASVLVFPSFQTEWAVHLVDERGGFLVRYAVMDTQLWGTLQQRLEKSGLPAAEVLRTLKVPVSRRSAPLAADTAHMVQAAWSAMLSAAERPAEPRIILDGTGYLFFGLDVGSSQRVGLTRSPEEGTPVAALAELVESLRQHAQSAPSARAQSEAEVGRKARNVLVRTGGL